MARDADAGEVGLTTLPRDVARGVIDVHRRLTARVGGGGSIDECLGILAGATAELLDADIGAILLLDERRPVVRLRAVQGARSPRWREGLEIPLDGTLNGAAIRTGAVQRVDDWQLETGRVAADVRAVVAAEDVRSLMVAPLLTESGVVGTLAAARRAVRPFGEDADFLLQLLADHAALTLHEMAARASLEEARGRLVEAHRRSADALGAVARHVTDTADLASFFGRLTATISDLLGAETVCFWRWEPSGTLSVVHDAHGVAPEITTRLTGIPCTPGAGGVTERVVLGGETLRWSLVEGEEPELPHAVIDLLGARDGVAAPWRAGSRPLGSVGAYSSTERAFTDEDALVLRIAGEAAGLVWERKQAEAELTRLAAEARAANESKGEFVNMLVHELRGPMTVIRGNLDMLAKGDLGPVPEGWAPVLRVVQEKEVVARRLVDDLLMAARLEARALPMRVRALDLRQAVAAAVERAQPAALLAGGSVECNLPPAPVVVEADEKHLGRILDNLLGNAVIHGGVRTGVCARVVGGASPVVLVEDHGRGIAAEARDHVFERFFRSRDSAARPGSGLGLYISRRLARQLGGDVTLEASEPGVRTVFALRLPASRPAEARRS